MEILVDSREKERLSFSHPYITDVKIEKLDVGDYRVEFTGGYRPPLVFERKSIGDLYGTMTNGYSRFKKEVERAADSNTQLIVIVEADLSTVAKGYKHSKFAGESMIKKLFTLWVRYKLMTVYCRNRKEMSEYILQTYLALGREYIRQKKGK